MYTEPCEVCGEQMIKAALLPDRKFEVRLNPNIAVYHVLRLGDVGLAAEMEFGRMVEHVCGKAK